MTLKECTKEELIYIINHIAERLDFKDCKIQSALIDVEYMRSNKQLNKATELLQIASQKRNEYINIMKPYDGMKYIDIPLDVLSKANDLLKEAQKADEEWNRIMKEMLKNDRKKMDELLKGSADE